jgi:Cell Wall Hydrolase
MSKKQKNGPGEPSPGRIDGRSMRFVFRCRMIPAALVAAGLMAGAAGLPGPALADTAGVTRMMTQENLMLRTASGARIAELTDVARPKAREEATVTVSTRSIDGFGDMLRRGLDRGPDRESDRESDSAEQAAVAAAELDLATLDALPSASGGAEWQCLAQAIYFESRGEPLEGQVAVAEVVLNRAEDRNFPPTVCGVTHQDCQFSYVCDGRSDTMKSGVARERSEKLASLMLAGRERSLTDGALYFHTRSVRPDWSRRFARTTTIGHHMFYRPATRVAGG